MLCFLFFVNEFYVFNFKKWAYSRIDLLPHFMLRKSFLVLLVSFTGPNSFCALVLLMLFLQVYATFIYLCLIVCPLLPSFKHAVLNSEPVSRSLRSTLVFLVSSPFSCSLESFVFAQAEHCLNHTLRAHGCFSPRFQSFPFYLLVSVRIGFRVGFPLTAYSAFWEMKLSARPVKKLSVSCF